MKLRPRRAVLICALAASAVALTITVPAQANTTLQGNNGKIAYTTNATLLPEEDSDLPQSCDGLSLPIGGIGGFPFDVLMCNAEIATINPDGTGFTQVTHNNVPDDRAAWLPQDGSKLAYQSIAVDPVCTKGSLTCLSYNIFDITPDGATGHQLTSTPGPLDLFNSQTPSYSPDGSRIAFEALNFEDLVTVSSRDIGQNPVWKQFNHVMSTIYTVPAGGETVSPPVPLLPADEHSGTSLVSDSQPTYSPDGQNIAFVRLTITPGQPQVGETRGVDVPSVTSSIYVAPAAGGPSHAVETTTPCQVLPNNISALLSHSNSDVPLTRSARGTRGFGPICTLDSAPAWSPDGSKIAVERITIPAELLLNNARAGTKGLIQIVEDSDIVVFNSNDGSGEVNLSDVTEPVDCGGDFESQTSCSLDQKPAWSPDGQKIAFFSDRNADGVSPVFDCFEMENESVCDDEIWTMNADGSSPAQLTNNDVNDINPDWQRIPPPSVPAQPAAPAPVKPKVGVAGVRRACVSKTFHVRFRVSTANSSVKSVVVKLDGRRIKSTKKGSFTLTINGKKLKAGRHRLTITATNAAGQVTTTRKSFSVCKAAKPRRKAAPRFTG
jgi:Tol biopolymer transport system component